MVAIPYCIGKTSVSASDILMSATRTGLPPSTNSAPDTRLPVTFGRLSLILTTWMVSEAELERDGIPPSFATIKKVNSFGPAS